MDVKQHSTKIKTQTKQLTFVVSWKKKQHRRGIKTKYKNKREHHEEEEEGKKEEIRTPGCIKKQQHLSQ